jgi:protein-S-isoprenylcysteine O-methyltransferase Ste14
MTRLRVFPLLFMFVLIAMVASLWLLLPGWRVYGEPATWFGVIPLTVGLLLIPVSAGLFRLRKTTLNPFGESSALVQDGLYRYSRNPMYLGMLLVLAGVAIGSGHLLAFVVLPVFVAVVSRQNIRGEEKFLEARFGDEYRSYKARVRRWI